MRSLWTVAVTSLVVAGAPSAQQAVGISVNTVISTSAGLHCGFDCGDPRNTGTFPTVVGRVVDVRLFGDAGLPGVVIVGLGPALSSCPGLALRGIHNSLQILPPNVLASAAVSSLARGSRSCGTTGSSVVVGGLSVLPVASGATLTWQGLVFDRGAPAFTRPVEMVVR